MAKSALGRGLQHLMKDRPNPADPQKPSEKIQVTPGMVALIRGGNGETNQQAPATQLPVDARALAAAVRTKKFLKASLLIADFLLVVLVTRLAFVSHGHFGLFEVTLSVFALAIGAWLSCLALWLK